MLPASTDNQPPKGTNSPENGTAAENLTFPGALHASTTSAWSVGLPFRARPSLSSSRFALSVSSSLVSRHATAQPADSSLSKVKEISGDALDEAARNLPTLTSDIYTLRIHVSLDKMPFVLLDALHTHLANENHLIEVHVCIESLLRPSLHHIHERLGLEQDLMSRIRKWQAMNTPLKLFFLRPDVLVGTTPEEFSNYQQIELLPAIQGLHKGSLGRSKILELAESDPPIVSGYTEGNSRDSDDAMDVDHDLQSKGCISLDQKFLAIDGNIKLIFMDPILKMPSAFMPLNRRFLTNGPCTPCCLAQASRRTPPS
jgi:hypothetical protein